jgi:hypothetical protein
MKTVAIAILTVDKSCQPKLKPNICTSFDPALAVHEDESWSIETPIHHAQRRCP